MKRIVSITVAAVICFIGIGLMPVFSAGTLTISVSDVGGERGMTIDVAVRVTNNTGICGLQIEAGYDSSVLELKSIEKGDFGGGSGEVSFSSSISINPQIICWEDALASENNTSNGTLAVLKFEILDTAESGDSEITLTYDADNIFDKDLENVPVTVQYGIVHVSVSDKAEDIITSVSAETTYEVSDVPETIPNSDNPVTAYPLNDETDTVGSNTDESQFTEINTQENSQSTPPTGDDHYEILLILVFLFCSAIASCVLIMIRKDRS